MADEELIIRGVSQQSASGERKSALTIHAWSVSQRCAVVAASNSRI